MNSAAPVRLLLVAGAAAATALFLRGPLSARVARALSPQVHDLAARAIRPAPVILKILPPRAEVAAPSVPLLPSRAEAAPSPASTVALAGHAPSPAPSAAPTSAPKAHVVKRAELEDAIANRLSGARAVLVRDEEGRPAGLALHGVAALARFGVHDGDVLVSANGLSLRSPDEALAALGALEHAARVVVTLRRGGLAYSVPIELVDD